MSHTVGGGESMLFSSHHSVRASFTLLCTLATLVGAASTPADAAPRVQAFEEQISGFPLLLPGDRIVDGSPTLADITGDGKPEIIVGGSDGRVYAISVTEKRLLWQFRTNTALNALQVQHQTGTTIRTAPAVADLNNDSRPEIVIGVGDVLEQKENGGIVVLNANGTLRKAWLSQDLGGGGNDIGSPDGYTDGVETSPAIGDITGDGVPEIVYGANDQHVYARRVDGSHLPGWPKFVRDTVHSSPAIANLDGVGSNEVIIGIDAHADAFYGDLEGGYVKVFRGDGSELPGWPQHEDDIVGSSPAIADVDGDGKLNVVIGVGGIRGNGKHITAYRENGSILWRRPTDGSSGVSPALGDINGDGQVDVVTLDNTNKIYAFNGKTGARLWVMTPRSIYGPEAMGKVILGDWDGDGVNDVFAPVGGQVAVVRGRDGVQLTSRTNPPEDAPVYDARSTMNSHPAVSDIDGDGKLELVACAGNGGEARGICSVWRLPNSSSVTSWPMFRGNPAHTGVYTEQRIIPSMTSLSSVLAYGTQRTYNLTFSQNWTVTENDPRNIMRLNRTSGTSTDTLRVTLVAPRSTGTFEASLTVKSPGLPDATVDVTVYSAEQVHNVYLPLIIR